MKCTPTLLAAMLLAPLAALHAADAVSKQTVKVEVEGAALRPPDDRTEGPADELFVGPTVKGLPSRRMTFLTSRPSWLFRFRVKAVGTLAVQHRLD